jgi:hypothetical protein
LKQPSLTSRRLSKRLLNNWLESWEAIKLAPVKFAALISGEIFNGVKRLESSKARGKKVTVCKFMILET